MIRAHPGVAAILSAVCLLRIGYTASGPVAITPIVGRPSSSAVRWASMSTPRASPLIIAGLCFVCARLWTVLMHHSFPYGVMSRVPTMPMLSAGQSSLAGVLLLIYKPVGASSHSFSRAGYESSVIPQNCIPCLSKLYSSSAAESTALLQICPLYLKYGPVSSSRSLALRRKTSVALPMCEIRACASLGSNPNMRFRAQRDAFSSMFSMHQSKNKTSFQTIVGSWLHMICVRFFLFLMLFSFSYPMIRRASPYGPNL